MSPEDTPEISLADLMSPPPPPAERDDGEDVVAIPESSEEKRQLDAAGFATVGSEEEPAPPNPDDREVVSGEVMPPLPNHQSLSPKQIQAAFVDASGASQKQIADIVGVSQSSVKQWRAMPDYKAEVERLTKNAITELEPAMQKMHKELIDATTAAIATLRDGLDATDDRGQPHWATRLRAAEKLVEHGVDFSKNGTATGRTPGGGLVPNASGAVVLVIRD